MYSVSNNCKTRLEQIRQRLKANIEDEVFMEQINIECSCCYSTKFVEEFVSCPKSHKICSQCVKTHATNIIWENGSFEIKCICMDESCDTNYSDKVLEQILDKKVFDQYLKLKIRNETKYIFDLKDLNLIKCQFCETVWDLDPEDKLLYCMGCGKKTCLECGQVAHPDRPCDKTRIKIEEGLTRENFLICSQCSRCISKETGCNAVRCPCGNNMCWGCKKSWGSTDAHGCTCKNLWGEKQKTNFLNEFAGNQQAQTYINKLR